MTLLTNKEIADLMENVETVLSKDYITRRDAFYLNFAEKLLKDNIRRTERKHLKLIVCNSNE